MLTFCQLISREAASLALMYQCALCSVGAREATHHSKWRVQTHYSNNRETSVSLGAIRRTSATPHQSAIPFIASFAPQYFVCNACNATFYPFIYVCCVTGGRRQRLG